MYSAWQGRHWHQHMTLNRSNGVYRHQGKQANNIDHNFCLLFVHGNIGLKWYEKCSGGAFPTNHDLADVLIRTDSHSEIMIECFGIQIPIIQDSWILDVQIPDSQLSRFKTVSWHVLCLTDPRSRLTNTVRILHGKLCLGNNCQDNPHGIQNAFVLWIKTPQTF